MSPLLANVMLDEVDKVLERYGHSFARYADDCSVYVGSRKAGERVMGLLRKCYDRLHLKVNEAKSAVAEVSARKCLGFSFWYAQGEVKRRVADQPMATLKQRIRQRIRQLTRRSGGRSLDTVIARLGSYLTGWKAYYGLAQTPGIRRTLDEWVRHRLRAIQLKHWRRGSTIHRELTRLGANESVARRVAGNSRCWWRNSGRDLNRVLTIAWFDQRGLPRLS